MHLSPNNLESVAEAVVLLDAAGQVMAANRRGISLLGLPERLSHGCPADEFPRVVAVIRGLSAGGCRLDEVTSGQPVSLRLPVGDSGRDFFAVEVHRLAEGVPPGVALVFRPMAPEPASDRCSVLVVDDDEMVRKITAAVLRQQGFEVMEAFDGADALTKWSEDSGNFDLVLLDMHMPLLSGIEVHERMRAACPEVKVVFLSGSLGDLPSEPLAGVGYLQKPFRNDELIATVRRAVGRRSSGQA